MLDLADPDPPSETTEHSRPIAVLSVRTFIRDLVVDFLQHHGFPQATGYASSDALLAAIACAASGLVLVDLENDTEDASKLLRDLRASRPEVSTVAIGTPMQLAAQAEDADGWIELSEPASRVTDFASARAQRFGRAQKRSGAHSAERLSSTWCALTGRQRQVLALLGCGMDNQGLAAALGVSKRAIKAHISALLDKFKADSRTELALIACNAKLHVPLSRAPFRL